MDVAVEAARGQDLAFAGDGLRAGADDDGRRRAGYPGLPALPIAGDPAVLEADIGLDDAPVVDDQRIGDHGVDGAFGPRRLALAHAVADDLAAAELHLLAIDGEILLHLDEEVGIGKPHLVARGRAVHVGIGGAGDTIGHQSSAPMTF